MKLLEFGCLEDALLAERLVTYRGKDVPSHPGVVQESIPFRCRAISITCLPNLDSLTKKSVRASAADDARSES